MPELTNEKDLQTWSDDTDKQVDELTAQVGRITTDIKNMADVTQINSTDWSQRDDEDGACYRLATFLKAMQRRDHEGIMKLGGQPVKWNKNTREFYLTKAATGSPLTGDDSSTVGSYLIPTLLYGDSVIRYANTVSEILPRLRKISMAGRNIRWPVEVADIALVFVSDEVTTKSETIPEFTYVDLVAETFAGWSGVSDEFMEDTFIDVGRLFRNQAVQALIESIETSALNSSSPFTGVMQYTSAATFSIGSTAFADISWDNLRDAKNELPTARARNRCVFAMHPTIWDILSTQQDAMGRYYWDPNRQAIRLAWGYPVVLSDFLPADTDTNGDTAFALFGPLDMILHGTRMGLEIKYFDETIYAVKDDQNFFRFRTRYAMKCGKENAFVQIKTSAS